MSTTSTPAHLSIDERTALLDGAVIQAARDGWTTVSRTPTQAQLVKGKPTNHVLHLILSLITFGLWLPVWIGVAVFAGQKQRLVTVDELGIVAG